VLALVVPIQEAHDRDNEVCSRRLAVGLMLVLAVQAAPASTGVVAFSPTAACRGSGALRQLHELPQEVPARRGESRGSRQNEVRRTRSRRREQRVTEQDRRDAL
jgi:hypothetical protein